MRMPVTSEDSGKELLLKFKNNYSNVSSDIEYPMLVSASSFAFYILQENAGIIITVILLLLLDIILVFLIIWLKNRSFWLSKTSLYELHFPHSTVAAYRFSYITAVCERQSAYRFIILLQLYAYANPASGLYK